MGLPETLLLGFVAGVTIVLGLPVGRLTRPAPVLRAMLNAVAVGVLLFLVWDVLTHAWEPIDVALGSVHEGSGGLGTALGYGALFAAGLAVGLLSLVGYERWMRAAVSGPSRSTIGPGTMSTSEVEATAVRRGGGLVARLARWSPGRQLALLIAVGIGLHNFAEGLAIGQSAAGGEIALATLLVIGFGLHNATEGFGIVAPLAGEVADDGSPVRPSWPFLLGLGLIGGGPTFLGTALGHAYTSEPVAVIFLTLAAGSILYVVAQLIMVAARSRRSDLLAYGMLLGLLAGFVTDAVVTAGGA